MLLSVPFDGMSGAPCGPPEWPYDGGILNQPAWLVDAYSAFRYEWPFLSRPEPKPRKAKGK